MEAVSVKDGFIFLENLARTCHSGLNVVYFSPISMDSFIIYLTITNFISLQLEFHLVSMLSSKTMTKLIRISYSKKRIKLTAHFLLSDKI